jgi:hypothetical protein
VVISAIDGTAGIGTTSLAVYWAHRVSDRFPGGTLYVNLRGHGPGQPAEADEPLRGIVGEPRAEAEPDALGEIARTCVRLPLALRITGQRAAVRPHTGLMPLRRRRSRALSSIRVMGPCAAMGAGAAHALEMAGDGSVHDTDLTELRHRLRPNLED